MVKIYFDASVIIAAILSKTGGSAKLLQFARLGVIAAVTSQTAAEEVEGHALKIDKTLTEIRQFIKDNKIVVREKISKTEEEPYLGLVEEDDIHIVVGAKSTKCDFLITLDKKHLLKKEVKKLLKPLKVVSPKEYLEKLV